MRLLTSSICAGLAMLVVATAAHAQTHCQSSIVTNGHFTDGWVPGSMPSGAVTGWTLLSASPQVVTDGCAADSGSVQMWGNLVVGESIQQLLPGAGIEAGKIYRVTVCYRWLDNNPILPPYVRFRLMAATNPNLYPPTGGYDLIGSTPNTSSTTWTSYTFPDWVAPNNATHLTVNPENDETQNHGDYVSWGLIDDICIERVQPVAVERKDWGQIKTLYSDAR